MYKIILSIFAALVLSQSASAATRQADCQFLGSEIQRYSVLIKYARDRFEYERYVYILKQYQNSFMMYCVPKTTGIFGTAPFRQQHEQSGGYLGR